MIGGIANVWCNQGIITTRAIHNNNENAPNTTADDKIPIGRGVALPILSILAFFINGSALLPCGIPQHSLCLGLPTVGEGTLTANVNDHIIANALTEPDYCRKRIGLISPAETASADWFRQADFSLPISCQFQNRRL
jgi:hypothetical protein